MSNILRHVREYKISQNIVINNPKPFCYLQRFSFFSLTTVIVMTTLFIRSNVKTIFNEIGLATAETLGLKDAIAK